MAMRINRMGGVVGAVVAALGLSVGCGDSFGGGDCHSSRTCEAAGGEAASAGGVTDTAAGASDISPSDGGAPSAGAAGDAGAAGAAGAGNCQVSADCSNDDPEDGEEVCNAGVCYAGNRPPTIVSFTPESDAVGVEPDASVVIAFSEPLDPKTVTSTNVQLLDGTTVVEGELSYADSKVTFKPATPLSLLVPYTVAVSTGVSDAAGAPLLHDASSQFSIRDGAWTTITVAKDGHSPIIADQLAMSSDGSVLLAWNGDTDAGCRTFGGWFLRGKAAASAVSLDPTEDGCVKMWSAGNSAGVGAVAWISNKLLTTRQYRAGAWQTVRSFPVSEYTNDARLAVTPQGAVTALGHDWVNGGSIGRTTNESGVWPSTDQPISSLGNSSDTSLALDAAGNGLAVWRANDPTGTHLERILASTFNAATGKWTLASELPGSLAATESSRDRGTPAVAVDQQGGAMAVWVDKTSNRLMANRYSLASWEDAEPISGGLTVDLSDIYDHAPALAFDGQTFVAAWTALDAGKRYVFTARYDAKTGWGEYERQQKAASDGTSAPTMPALVSDGRGNLILVFAKGATGSTYSRVYQRYSNDAWGPITALPDGAMNSEDLSNHRSFPLAISTNGLAAIAWSHYDDNFTFSVHLASFF